LNIAVAVAQWHHRWSW